MAKSTGTSRLKPANKGKTTARSFSVRQSAETSKGGKTTSVSRTSERVIKGTSEKRREAMKALANR
ncbi:MAG: hypothetical protein AAF415_18235 [Pseudomonadota bacterium]